MSLSSPTRGRTKPGTDFASFLLRCHDSKGCSGVSMRGLVLLGTAGSVIYSASLLTYCAHNVHVRFWLGDLVIVSLSIYLAALVPASIMLICKICITAHRRNAKELHKALGGRSAVQEESSCRCSVKTLRFALLVMTLLATLAAVLAYCVVLIQAASMKSFLRRPAMTVMVPTVQRWASTMSKNVALAQCGCGGVRFEADLRKGIPQLTVCNCAACRKVTGAVQLPFLALPRKSVTFTEEATLREWEPTALAKRLFCTGCGAQIAMDYREENTIWICLGLLCDDQHFNDWLKNVVNDDGHINLKYPCGHIFWESRPPIVEVLYGDHTHLPVSDDFGVYVYDAAQE